MKKNKSAGIKVEDITKSIIFEYNEDTELWTSNNFDPPITLTSKQMDRIIKEVEEEVQDNYSWHIPTDEELNNRITKT